ncbi:MAG: hypothetical protein CME13_09165 [Gemmatimonadetes bacterium]|nr:hypothetical protein [Gemmatimonadota bacterium]MBU08128.1 hypothetical protein [Gemmatimonadota bacterium]
MNRAISYFVLRKKLLRVFAAGSARPVVAPFDFWHGLVSEMVEVVVLSRQAASPGQNEAAVWA